MSIALTNIKLLQLPTNDSNALALYDGSSNLNLPDALYAGGVIVVNGDGYLFSPNGQQLNTDSALYDPSGNNVTSLFGGSDGNVLYAQKSAQEFSTFFADQGYSSSGSSGDFLNTDGVGDNLTFQGSAINSTVQDALSVFPNGAQSLVVLDGGGALQLAEQLNIASGAILLNGDASASFAGGDVTISSGGAVSATSFSGDGSNLSNVIAQTGNQDAQAFFSGTDQEFSGTSGRILFDNGDGSSLDLSGNAGIIITAFDSGWTPNADAGDKTLIIPSSGTITTLVAALDPTNVGYGALLKNTAEKVKALEAAAAAGLAANA